LARVDSEKLRAHIKSKAGRVKCPICRRGPIYFSDAIYGVPEVFDRANMNQKPIMAVIPLRCDNCGGVSFIDPMAAQVGIIADEEPNGEIVYLK